MNITIIILKIQNKLIFILLIIIKMKKYTLDELLNTKKAKKIIDENLSSYNDENVVYAVLEINY
jgi:hypothetical protein